MEVMELKDRHEMMERMGLDKMCKVKSAPEDISFIPDSSNFTFVQHSKYEKPQIVKVNTMVFPMEILKMKTGKTVCKQCSSCHGCK